MRATRDRTRRLLAGLTVGLVHLLILWALMPIAMPPVVAPDSAPQSIDVWLGPPPGGADRAANPSAPQTRNRTTPLPIEPRKPPPRPHPDPIPPKAEPEKTAAPAVTPPAPSAPPSMAAGTANWSGRGLGRGVGRGLGRDLGGGGAGGAGEDRGRGPKHYVWARELTSAERLSVYPAAGRYTAGGLVVLSCLLRGEDRLGGCLILTEQPAGHGFGAAAVRASQLRGVRPVNPDDQPGPGERINVEMRFVRLEASR